MSDSSAPTPGARALLRRWESESIDTVWRRPGDWYTPAADALAEALDAGLDTSPAAYRLGQSRSAAGVGITEAIDDMSVLFRAAGHEAAPIHSIRSLCEGWTAGTAPTLVAPVMTDAESGLGTSEYLSQRLAEVYNTAARFEHVVNETHALVMVDVSVESSDPWQRIARNAAAGAALRGTYGEGHPMARLSDGLYVVLIERDETLGAGLATLREQLAGRAVDMKVESLMRQPPRVWIESLPGTHAYACDLMESLQR